MFSTEQFRDAMNGVVLYLSGFFYLVCVVAIGFNLATGNLNEPPNDAKLIATTTAVVSVLAMLATVFVGALANAVSYGVQRFKETRN